MTLLKNQIDKIFFETKKIKAKALFNFIENGLKKDFNIKEKIYRAILVFNLVKKNYEIIIGNSKINKNLINSETEKKIFDLILNLVNEKINGNYTIENFDFIELNCNFEKCILNCYLYTKEKTKLSFLDILDSKKYFENEK